jgi:hypothetical protein
MSALPEPFPHAIAIIATVMESGSRTHPENDWRFHPAGYHIERARKHLALLAAGDNSEPHLAHTATRLLMALELTRR